MTAAMAIPGNGVSTFLVYDFGGGLDGDDRFVVERFRALACGDIRPVRPETAKPKGRRKAKRIVVSRKEAETMLLLLMLQFQRPKLMMKPSLAQIEFNKIEAGHRSTFVAGWRPFIGWVCGFALLWHFILFDLLTWVTGNYFPRVTALPELTGTETLVTELLSLLGLGAMRTAEKFGEKAR